VQFCCCCPSCFTFRWMANHSVMGKRVLFWRRTVTVLFWWEICIFFISFHDTANLFSVSDVVCCCLKFAGFFSMLWMWRGFEDRNVGDTKRNYSNLLNFLQNSLPNSKIIPLSVLSKPCPFSGLFQLHLLNSLYFFSLISLHSSYARKKIVFHWIFLACGFFNTEFFHLVYFAPHIRVDCYIISFTFIHLLNGIRGNFLSSSSIFFVEVGACFERNWGILGAFRIIL